MARLDSGTCPDRGLLHSPQRRHGPTYVQLGSDGKRPEVPVAAPEVPAADGPELEQTEPVPAPAPRPAGIARCPARRRQDPLVADPVPGCRLGRAGLRGPRVRNRARTATSPRSPGRPSAWPWPWRAGPRSWRTCIACSVATSKKEDRPQIRDLRAV